MMSENKNYFYCMKKTREDCQEDIFGKPNCNFCEHKENCENCGRKDTSFCEKCEVKDEQIQKSANDCERYHV